MKNIKILFVCEYNACRSQMAEGLARALLPPSALVKSAGLYPAQVDQLTAEVMREIDINLSNHFSKPLQAVSEHEYDYLVLLAEPTAERTNAIRCKQRLLWFFPDPVKEPDKTEVVKEKIRAVRDVLKTRIEALFGVKPESKK